MSDSDTSLFPVLLDTLVPPRPELGLAGAGRPEVVAYVRKKMEAAPGVTQLVDAGVAVARDKARELHGQPFEALTQNAREQVVRAVEAEQPFFLPVLLLQVYPGYYQQPDVLESIGYPARPPFPKGYDVAVDDAALHRKLRARIGRPEVQTDHEEER